MQTILRYTILQLFIIASTLSASNMTVISEDADGSDIVEVLIKGNGEHCRVWMDSTGKTDKTNCIRLTNSKKIKILCTKKKKICKTEKEIYDYLVIALSSPKDVNHQKINMGTWAGKYKVRHSGLDQAEDSELEIEKNGDVLIDVQVSFKRGSCGGGFSGVVVKKTKTNLYIKPVDKDSMAQECSIHIKLVNGNLDVMEEKCSYYHGTRCGLGGIYTKK